MCENKWEQEEGMTQKKFWLLHNQKSQDLQNILQHNIFPYSFKK